ncbi:MAG: outer membrane beta-barrel protein [Gemmatimonadales bacterium]
MRTISLIVLAAALAVAPQPAAGQFVEVSSGLSFGVGVGVLSLDGSDFDGVGSGPSASGAVRYTTLSGLTFGVRGTVSRHDVETFVADLTLVGVNGEFRYSVRELGRRSTPFVALGVGWVRQSTPEPDNDRVANGLRFGAEGGIQIQLGGSIYFEGAVEFATLRFKDTVLRGKRIPGTDSDGRLIGLRLGLLLLP